MYCVHSASGHYYEIFPLTFTEKKKYINKKSCNCNENNDTTAAMISRAFFWKPIRFYFIFLRVICATTTYLRTEEFLSFCFVSTSREHQSRRRGAFTDTFNYYHYDNLRMMMIIIITLFLDTGQERTRSPVTNFHPYEFVSLDNITDTSPLLNTRYSYVSLLWLVAFLSVCRVVCFVTWWRTTFIILK